MRNCLFPLVYVCLLFGAAYSQPAFTLNEEKIVASVSDEILNLAVTVRAAARVAEFTAQVELLDENDTVISRSAVSSNLARGENTLRFDLPVSKAVIDKMLWHRLRYAVSIPNSSNQTSGFVALSEAMPELFELQVTAPSRAFSGMNMRTHVLAIHPNTKKPVAGVTIFAKAVVEFESDTDEDERAITAQGKTNSEGVVSLDLKIPTGLKLEDDIDLEIKGTKGGIAREADSYIDVSRNAFAYLFTDKPLYQPTQRLLVRAMYLDNRRRPVADEELEIEIEDEQGESVHQTTITTTRFGVASFEWKLPADLKLGKYTIRVDNDDYDGVGKSEFRVSRYDLPNFTVNAKPSKTFYLIDEKFAEVRVDAAYLFGKPVESGTVKIVDETDRTTNFSGEEYDTDGGREYTGVRDASGTFSAQVDLTGLGAKLKEDEWKRFVDAKFTAYFTDASTNRTESKRFDVRISKEAIHVYFVRPAADPNPTVPFQFYVSTFYADGTPARSELTVSGHYENATTDKVLARQRANAYGAAKFELKFPEKPFSDTKNEFNFRIAAADKDGAMGTFNENVYVNVGSRQIRVKTDKSIYADGQAIDARVLSTENRAAFIEAAKDGSVIWSKRIELADGTASVTIPYRPDFKGEIAVSAYFYNDSDELDYSFWTRTVIYPAPSDLTLGLSALKSTYRPGDDARLSFSVRSSQGVGVESALGIVMVDKAIEERGRVDRAPDNLAGLRKLLGTSDSFGDLTRKDLNKIDTTKPVSADLQLAAEYLLAHKRYAHRSFASDSYGDSFGSLYRAPMAKRLEPAIAALTDHYKKSSEIPQETSEVKAFFMNASLNYDELRDAWGMPFISKLRKDRGDVVIEFSSASADKKAGTTDDFVVGEVRFQWFEPTLRRIGALTRIDTPEGPKPATADEFKGLIDIAGIDLSSIEDDANRPVFLATQLYSRDTIKTELENVGNLGGEQQTVSRSRPVNQRIALHSFMSSGRDGLAGNYDDYSLGSFVVVLAEVDLMSERGGKIELSSGSTINNRGAIGGTVFDMMGAVIPGSKVTATRAETEQSFQVTSNSDGFYLLANLPSGRYRLKVESSGFRNSIIENIIVSAFNLVKADVTMEVGDVTSVVEVTGGVPEAMEASSSQIQTSATRSDASSISAAFSSNRPGENFTPRVREYFPETLIWQPELITDKSGRAQLDFKFADSLTTWKLYAIGSTETGEIGFVEKEVETFQPFFAELDPPKILTVGDRISLPVPVRNYTSKRQRVNVSLEPNTWSTVANGPARQISVEPNSSSNAVFDLVATSPVTAGRQRAFARAGKESDAIEKSVTVRPNGLEVVEAQAQNFQNEAAFDIEFPNGAFTAHRSVMLKVYPNMLAHVAESVEGLLQRPYGCGEQTTSSTYPNLLILKIEKDLRRPLPENTRSKALEYLKDGYARLLNYQTASGGFSYWGSRDAPDPALTAYVIQFMTDAETFIEVDASVVKAAAAWLAAQQREDGSWATSRGDSALSTAFVVRSMQQTGKTDPVIAGSLAKGINFMERSVVESADPYVLATTALVAARSDRAGLAMKALKELEAKAISKSEEFYWPARSTPFNGWGATAEIEATAISVQAFIESKRLSQGSEVDSVKHQTIVSGALRYLLAKKDRYGVWHSTQTTLNVLNALIAVQRTTKVEPGGGGRKMIVKVNGSVVREFDVEEGSVGDPILIDISNGVAAGKNRVDLVSASDSPSLVGAQIVMTYYVNWAASLENSRHFDLKIDFDRTVAAIGEEIACSVIFGRKSSGGNGMVLAEIGLPPGAEVDRATLDAALEKTAISRYDILPDRVVAYAWASTTPIAFSFKFKPRYGIVAQTPASTIYDYYNPEAHAVVAPVRFVVK